MDRSIFDCRIGRYHFAPRVWSILATAAFLMLFANLSHWQYRRGVYKQSLEQALAAQAARPPMSLKTFLKTRQQLPLNGRFARVTWLGRYVPEATWLLDNRIYQHKVGFEVLNAVAVPGMKQRVIVNRGWVLANAQRKLAVPLQTPLKRVLFVATADTNPSARLVLKAHGEAHYKGPKVMQSIDFKEINKASQVPVLPYVFHLSKTTPGVFKPNWHPVYMKSSKHFGYAVQWAAFGITLIILFIALNTTREDD